MGAPKGNTFYLKRSKHGREKLFSTPELLLQAAVEYFQWCDDNPWIKKEAIKSGELAGTTMDVPMQRPYTLSGFCLYCDASEEWLREFRKRETSKDFLGVISWIESTVRLNKFEGAVVGAFNANIIARDLGLGDKVESTSTNINYNTNLSKEEIQQISKSLEDEY